MRDGPRSQSISTLNIIAALIIVCTFIEAVLLAGDLGIPPVHRLRATAIEYAGFWPGLLDDWRPNYPLQKWAMFVTYGFLHAGPVHLILNMLTLFVLGTAMEARVGPFRFSLLYVASLLGGAMGFALLNDDYRPMVGASGALFGLAGALLAWDLADRVTLEERLWPVARAVLMLAVLNVALYYAMNGHLAWETHLGGFVTGWIAALVIGQRPLA